MGEKKGKSGTILTNTTFLVIIVSKFSSNYGANNGQNYSAGGKCFLKHFKSQ